MLLYLIRHGETVWNQQKRYFGASNIGLSSNGIKQGKSLRLELKGVCVDYVYSSGSRRTYDFACLIFPGHRINKTRGLRELGFGVFEGRTHAQLMNECPDIYSRWLKDPYNVRIPKGENFPSFRNRVLNALRRIIRKSGANTVAVVTHGGPIRIILGVIFKSRILHRFMPGLATVNIIKFTKGKASLVLSEGSRRKKHG
jgi:broad specificity phosphatase PhoE